MKSILFGTDNAATSNSATQYHYILNPNSGGPTASEVVRQFPIPVKCVLRNFNFNINVAPGVGTSWAMNVRRNSADSVLGVTIADAAKVGSNTTNAVTFYPGDTISLSVAPTATPTVFSYIYWDMECSAPGQLILGGCGVSLTNTATNYGILQGGSSAAWATTESDAQIVCPTGGTISRMYVRTNGTAGSGKSYQFTLQKNGSDTLITATISGSSATTANDTANTVSVSAGDTLSMKITPSGTPTARAAFWGLLFVPTVDGESFIGFGNAGVPSNSSTSYEQGFYVGAASASWTATESTVKGYIGPQTLKKMYMKVNVAPGGAASWDFTIRKNNVNTALTVNMTGATTTANVTSDVTFASGDSITLSAVPTSTPTAATGGVHGGYLVYFAPSATHRIFIT